MFTWRWHWIRCKLFNTHQTIVHSFTALFPFKQYPVNLVELSWLFKLTRIKEKWFFLFVILCNVTRGQEVIGMKLDTEWRLYNEVMDPFWIATSAVMYRKSGKKYMHKQGHKLINSTKPCSNYLRSATLIPVHISTLWSVIISLC